MLSGNTACRYSMLRLRILRLLIAFLIIAGGFQVKTGAEISHNEKPDRLSGNWTWISGDKSKDKEATYGTKGVSDAKNNPGARHGCIGWADSKNNLWLFGGDSGTGSRKLHNDLWKFNGEKWTWISGDDSINQRGVYGTKGISSPANKPGSRYDSISWIDKEGNFWLFGGYGYAEKGFLGVLNDLWKFDGKEWTWVSGDNLINHRGIYGIKGTAGNINKPGARYGSTSWTDNKGNFWLFGGYGYAGTGLIGILNDLWKFNGKKWTWISGDNRQNEPGNYDSKGITGNTNEPGPRYGSISWTDKDGNLWLFGGQGYNHYRIQGGLNDLWKFNGKEWTWVSGDNMTDRRGIYGIKGTADPANKPGARYGSISWTDKNGDLWLFGGYGYDSIRTSLLNDLWKFNGKEWTWVSGDNKFPKSIHGTKGIADPANKPGPRVDSVSWIDKNGSLWLFGGRKLSSYYYNDLWKFKK